MRKLKYIVIDNGYGAEVPVVFPEGIEHGQVAHRYKPISAGWCYLYPASVWGESTSLGIESRAEDAGLIDAFFGREV